MLGLTETIGIAVMTKRFGIAVMMKRRATQIHDLIFKYSPSTAHFPKAITKLKKHVLF
jgi:hypothetical protein